MVEFGATLAWRSPDDVPREPLLPDLRGSVRCSITEARVPGPSTRRITGEIRALEAAELGSTLEAVLRALTAAAALTEAVLEVDAVRTVAPRVSAPPALEELARDIWAAGFWVRFGPSWTPAPPADVCVGVGDDGGLREFLGSHPAWSTG